MACLHQPQKTEIVRVIGYERPSLGRNTISFTQTDLNKMTTFNRASPELPVASLGTMHQLPKELLSGILGKLDMKSVLSFRNVNRRARSAVCSLLEFSVVTTHARTCFLAIGRVGLAQWFTFNDIYWAMLRPKCDNCHRPGRCLYLLTGVKACEYCITTDAQFNTLDLEGFEYLTLKKIPSWSATRLRGRIAVASSLPDDHGRPRLDLINLPEAHRNVFGDVGWRWYCDRNHLCRVTVPLPFFYIDNQKAYTKLACLGCLCESKWLRRGRQNFEQAAVDYAGDYTPPTLLAHFEACVMAKVLWAASREGTLVIEGQEMNIVGAAMKKG